MTGMIRSSDQDVQRTFARRTVLLGGGKLALFGVLGLRLYYLQVVEADRYRMLSQDNQFNLELLPPIRGRIFDRSGLAVADNQDNFRIEIVSEQTPDVMATLDSLRTLVHIDDWDVKRVLKDVRRKRGFVPVTVAENLSRSDISRVAVNTPYLPGIRIEVGRTRFYPYSEGAVHVTGYVAAVSDSELTGDPVLELPDFRIGKSGIEKLHDVDLRGSAGQRQVEINALGRIIRKLPGDEGVPGKDVYLTIDMELQRFATKRIEQGRAEVVTAADPRVRAARGQTEEISPADVEQETVYLNEDGDIVPAESGAAVVMDVHTGEVLALASTPGFDPNALNQGMNARDWEELLSNPRSPFTNKTVAGQYPPGSTFKMLVLLAALEAGVAGPESRIYCPGHLDFGTARFHCWKRHGHGWLDMIESLEQSCDVYLYEMAKRLGIDRISAVARRLGLGSRLDLDLPGERSGLVPSREWKLADRGEPWQKGETLITGIGQGFLLTTPLQLAVMTARLVNGGYAVKPRLTPAVPGTEEEPASLGFKKNHLAVILQGMEAVMTGERGTARGSAIREPGFEIGGKTGTAQVRRITKAERLRGITKNKDRPWRDRDHALFVGYGPVEAPRYCVSVVVEHGGGGSSMAAPIARDILMEVMRRDPSARGVGAGTGVGAGGGDVGALPATGEGEERSG